MGTADMLATLERVHEVDSTSRRERDANWKNLTEHERGLARIAESERDDRFYEALFASQAVHNYHSFLLSGWGKFRDPEGIAPGYSGSIDDPAIAARLLAANNIQADPAHCEGVHWC
jgi:hypothetical protein